jgi:hypothetical protein
VNVWGYRKDDLLGRPISRCCPPPSGPPSKNTLDIGAKQVYEVES